MTKTITISEKVFNTYATVDEADEYFLAKFGSEWSDIGETQKPQLLITATRFIETKNYLGEVVDEDQELKFPRLISDEETSEEILTNACCEIAESIYRNNGLNADISNISSVSMADSSISFRNNATVESEPEQMLYTFLKDYMPGNVRVLL